MSQSHDEPLTPPTARQQGEAALCEDRRWSEGGQSGVRLLSGGRLYLPAGGAAGAVLPAAEQQQRQQQQEEQEEREQPEEATRRTF